MRSSDFLSFIICYASLLFCALITTATASKDTAPTCTANGSDCENKSQTSPSKRRIIFDCDPGLDDAFAMIWLLEGFKNNLYSIDAFTGVAGNIPGLDSYRNIMHTINLTLPTANKLTRETRSRIKAIPIGKIHESQDAEFEFLDGFFGEDGFSGLSETFVDFPNVFASKSRVKKWYNNAARTPFSEDLIIEKVLAHPGEVSIVCVGPVTNLRLAEEKHPGLLSLVKDIYIMGGTFSYGNVDPLTEFNFKYDSQSLAHLFGTIDNMTSGVPNVFIFPMDVTTTLQWGVTQFELLYGLLNPMKQSEIEMCRMKIEGVDEEVTRMYDMQEEDVFCTQAGLMHHFLEKATEQMILAHYEEGIGDFMELHDVSLVGFLMYPQLFDFKYVECLVDADTGMIWFDQRLKRPSKEEAARPNCFVLRNVDQERFLRAFTRDMMHMLNHL